MSMRSQKLAIRMEPKLKIGKKPRAMTVCLFREA